VPVAVLDQVAADGDRAGAIAKPLGLAKMVAAVHAALLSKRQRHALTRLHFGGCNTFSMTFSTTIFQPAFTSPVIHFWIRLTKPSALARVVVIGPKAQSVVTGCLAGRDVPEDRPLFSPARDREERFEAMRAARKSKVQPSQQDRKKAEPKRAPRESWTVRAYTKAVARACRKAGVEHWHVGQMRHTHATAVRALLGLEAAQASRGHARADVTQVYAERDLALAEKVAREMG
jgi:hypothetical protein